MAGADHVLFNNLERASSSDLNALQSVQTRILADVLRRAFSTPIYPTAGSVPTSSPRAVVLGGLEVAASGTDIVVSPGVLAQDSATLVPTPGTVDSNYRIGIVRDPTTIVMPVPGSESWLVVEAQVVEVEALAESRDIWDAGSSAFVPAVVTKRNERRVAFQVSVIGTSNVPAYSGGDWVPIAIIRRPAGGGAVALSDIYDVRPLEADRARTGTLSANVNAGRRGLCILQAMGDLSASDPNIVRLTAAETFSRSGDRIWLSSASINLGDAAYHEGGLTFAADTWYYVYLAPWRGAPVRGAQAGLTGNAISGNGLLIVSAVAPGRFHGLNTAEIIPSAPFATGAAIAAGDAVCVGAVRRNAGNTGWIGMHTADGHLVRLTAPLDVETLSPPTGTTTVTGLGAVLPIAARTALVTMDWRGGDTADSRIGVTVRGDGRSYVVSDQGTQANGLLLFEVPVEMLANTNFDLVATGSVPHANTVVYVKLEGWRM